VAVLWAGPGGVLAGLTAAALDGFEGFSGRQGIENQIHLLVDAAAWMGSDRGAQAVLAAGVQQRLVRPADLLAVVAANRRLARLEGYRVLRFPAFVVRYRGDCVAGRIRGALWSEGGRSECGPAEVGRPEARRIEIPA
jgi:hypothetical protein